MDLVKSIVITADRVYLSGISTMTLKDRTRAIYDMDIGVSNDKK